MVRPTKTLRRWWRGDPERRNLVYIFLGAVSFSVTLAFVFL